jgi:glycosyltransferase involved in cell wall biosynthesis
MNIALISYEYPPDAAYGGIATYVHQAARVLAGRGHRVEVFTSSPTREGITQEEGVRVHRVRETDQRNFALPIGRVFAARHSSARFDLLEGPDYAADAREAVRLVPDIPFVLKLHTPSILLLKLNYYEHSFPRRLAAALRALRARRRPLWGYDHRFAGEHRRALQADRVERAHARDADEIAAPSHDIGQAMIAVWGLEASRVAHVPYPYVPAAELLAIPVETRTNVVTFVGRLEVRKGVIPLARAIPRILRDVPRARFRFVGASEPSPQPNVDMREYLERLLGRHRDAVEFTGPVAPDRIPAILASSDVCVFPSLWENFPCVCLEAMAAGRGVVGSDAGGMADMLDRGRVGRTIPPRSPRAIAAAVIELLRDPELRIRLGRAARERLRTAYNSERIGELQEAGYLRAIERRHALGPRKALPVRD